MGKKVMFIVLVLAVLASGFVVIAGNANRNAFRDGLAQIQQMDEKRTTLLEVAMSTSRMSLGPVVSDMAAWESDLMDLQVPSELEAYKAATMEVGRKGREMVLVFMAGDQDTDITPELMATAEAAEARDALLDPLLELKDKSILYWAFN